MADVILAKFDDDARLHVKKWVDNKYKEIDDLFFKFSDDNEFITNYEVIEDENANGITVCRQDRTIICKEICEDV